MPILFAENPGRVVRLTEPATQCQLRLLGIGSRPDVNGIAAGGDNIDFISQLAIVTRVTLAQRVNIQVAHMIGTHVYVYVFGDRVGQIGLSGLGFGCSCTPPPGWFSPGIAPGKEIPGAVLMYDWYRKHRASKRPAPVAISLGGVAMEGFVVDFTEDAGDAQTGIVQWNMTMISLPQDN